MDYVEIYADEDSVSHFRDRNITFSTGEVAPPMLPLGVSSFQPATEVGFLKAPAGWVGGWHQPPTDGFVLVLSGEWLIEVGDGEIRRFPVGSVWLHKDRSGSGHNTRVVSSEDAVCVMIKFPDV